MDGPSRARARARAREIIEEFRPGSKLRETIFFLAVSLTRTWGSALGLVAAAYWAAASGSDLTPGFVRGFPCRLACANLRDARANEHSIECRRPQRA